ncbi:MAG: GumC family protein [Hyphomonadaceae bacterium]
MVRANWGASAMSGRTGGAKTFFSWAETPKLGLADIAILLWTERALALMVGAGVMALALLIALITPKTYLAHSDLLVRLGQEYVYQPNVGAAGAGAAPDIEAVVNAEIRMIASPEVARRTIRAVGAAKLYPALAGASASRQEALALKAFAADFSATATPRTPALSLTFKHRNAAVAAETLNTLVSEYLAYRRQVLVGGESDALSHQAGALDSRVVAANTALSEFLAAHQIGDYDSELAAAAQRAADVEAQLLDAQAKRREAEGRAAALRARYNSEPAQIELYSESDARRALVQLQLDREQLLARYQPDAPPVRDIDRRINQVQTFLADGDPASLTRRGANPLRQEMASQLFAVEAEARAQTAREAELDQQRTQLRDRLRTLQQLEPQYRQLARQRTILEANAQNFATRAEESRAFDQLLGRSTDNISVIERASPPAQGKSLRWPILFAGFILACLAAGAVGLARGLLRRSFPTPQSAARTLGAPVLAVTPARAGPKPTAQKSPPEKKAARPAAAAKNPRLKVLEGGK